MCRKSTIFFTERHLLQKAVKLTHNNSKFPFFFKEQYPLLDVMMCRNPLDKKDSKVLATLDLAQFLTTLLQSNSNPKSYTKDQTQISTKSRKNYNFFCKFDVHSPGELEPEVVKQKWKIHYFSSPNFCLFQIQSQITFRYIVVITSVICFCPSQNRNTQCIQECIFIKILVIKHNLSHITQPNGEIMQYGAGQQGIPGSRSVLQPHRPPTTSVDSFHLLPAPRNSCW